MVDTVIAASYSAGGEGIAKMVRKALDLYGSTLLAEEGLSDWEVPLRSVGLLQSAEVAKVVDWDVDASHVTSLRVNDTNIAKLNVQLDRLDEAASLVVPRKLPPRYDDAFISGGRKVFEVLLAHHREEHGFIQRVRTKLIFNSVYQ